VSPPPVPPPPGSCERVRAASALVLAPHFDDEVLGCGGLLAQLAAAGATVCVLFLTDGGGGREAVADRDSYRLRRRQEALAAAAVLGIAGCDFLDLPDGGLAQHLAQAADGVRQALLGQRPELLLCPSPLEVTADHRAAFAAAHVVLGSWRLGFGAAAAAGGAAGGAGGEVEMAGGEATALAGLRILLYEVNQPAYPDLLVDVSAAEELLRRAMACYASQQERHPYLDAALGLRRFRTLSLGPGAGLAEGYRQLAIEDFTTRSPAQLVRHLGGEPALLEVREGPTISVVVRTRDRPELLAEALGSLAAGEYRRVTVVLVNDGGAPPPVPAGFAAAAAAGGGGTAGAAARHAPQGVAAGALPLLRIDLPAPRGRAAAAAAGIAAATGDYVAFLDDDDLAAPEHLATLAGMVSAAAVRIAYTDAAVGVYELDGEAGWTCRERRLPYSRDFDPDMLLVDNYIPFNTVLIERRLLDEVGPPDETLPFFEDWDLLIRLAALAPFHHLARVTCEYRHFRGPMNHVFGERPRERADFLLVKARLLAKHAARLTPAALARAVDTLRGELVAEREAAAAGERRLEAVRREHAELARANRDLSAERFHFEDRFHAVHGELQALRDDHQRVREEARRLGEETAAREAAATRLSSELQRVYGEESRLHAAADEQAAHLGRTYAEIERLNRLVREMEASRAWRLHQWLQRRRS
jgi:LmbE family N-acetylglucosaminyl deacetylase/glycosyltransferase involved in cell wall biosynthesis